jgi:hypothetical protein
MRWDPTRPEGDRWTGVIASASQGREDMALAEYQQIKAEMPGNRQQAARAGRDTMPPGTAG